MINIKCDNMQQQSTVIQSTW